MVSLLVASGKISLLKSSSFAPYSAPFIKQKENVHKGVFFLSKIICKIKLCFGAVVTAPYPLTQQMMAELFDTTVPNINMHIKNIYKKNELAETATIKDFLIVLKEGKKTVSRGIAHYNLDIIISVGYRIKSKIATKFRIWATKTLKEYLTKDNSAPLCFALN